MPLGSKFVASAPVLTFTPNGSTTATDIAPFAKDLNMPQSMATADLTGYTNTNHQYQPTLPDLSISWVTFLETGNVIEDLIGIPGAKGTVIFAPNGTTVGMRKYTLAGFISQFDAHFPYSDGATADTTFMPTGNLTRGVYP